MTLGTPGVVGRVPTRSIGRVGLLLPRMERSSSLTGKAPITGWSGSPEKVALSRPGERRDQSLVTSVPPTISLSIPAAVCSLAIGETVEFRSSTRTAIFLTSGEILAVLVGSMPSSTSFKTWKLSVSFIQPVVSEFQLPLISGACVVFAQVSPAFLKEYEFTA